MEKNTLTKQFAARLWEAMIAAGMISQRSTSGIDIHQLAEITGHSVQICRKYLRGEALPEPVKLIQIASKLKVSPGWLLFGEALHNPSPSSDRISFDKHLLRYIFSKATSLYNSTLSDKDVSDFLLDLITDVSQINANEEQSKKIIDLAISSAQHFSQK